MAGLGVSLRRPEWDLSRLIPFQKDFYREHPAISELSPEEVEELRRQLKVTLKGPNLPRPVRTFEEASFPDYILQAVKSSGFEKPTPIQAQGWPIALTGRDMVGLAETGSGKTLAFVLPAIVHINAQPFLQPGDGPIVLILVTYYIFLFV